MSWAASTWANKQRPGRVADKMVLIALADCHNEENELAWPSLEWLCDFCCLDRKTVIAAIARLEAADLIADSGVRYGRTKQVKAYRLHIEAVPETEPLETMPEAEPLRPKGTGFSVKESQKRYTEPSKEPSKSKCAHAMPDGWSPREFGSATKSAKIADSELKPPTIPKDSRPGFRSDPAHRSD